MSRTRTVGEDMLMQNIPVPPPLTEEQKQVARKVVCANSADAAEAHDLLSMLGLL